MTNLHLSIKVSTYQIIANTSYSSAHHTNHPKYHVLCQNDQSPTISINQMDDHKDPSEIPDFKRPIWSRNTWKTSMREDSDPFSPLLGWLPNLLLHFSPYIPKVWNSPVLFVLSNTKGGCYQNRISKWEWTINMLWGIYRI